MPMPDGASQRVKEAQLEASLEWLLTELHKLQIGGQLRQETPIILIAKCVYMVCCQPLCETGFTICNSELVEFPGSGGQVKFRTKMATLLRISDRVF